MIDVSMSVRVDVVKHFEIATARTFSPIFAKPGTRDPCANTQKNCGTDFQNFYFKIFG